MIARIWYGRTKRQDAETYSEYVSRTGIKALKATDGNLGAYLLRRIDGDEAEFAVLSLWESIAKVRNFAGKATEKAVYYPEDERYLLRLDPRVRHFEVLAGPADGLH